MVQEEGGMGSRGHHIVSLSFSPACLCVEYNDIISQEIQAVTGLCWIWLTTDIKHKKQTESEQSLRLLPPLATDKEAIDLLLMKR